MINNFLLRDYQKDIISKTINTQKSTLIQIPTGGGKTIIAKEIIKDLINQNKSILFVVPKLILMDQTLEVFEDLNPQVFHGNKKHDLNKNLFISTIQTASKRKKLKPDVIFIDEIHYGFAGKMINTIKLENPQARIIGLSATPYDKHGELLKGFDLVLDKYDMKYMIKNKYLTSLVSYSLVKQDLSNIKITAGDYNLKELGKLACKDYLITQITNTTKDYIMKSNKTIVFAVNIEHTKLLELAYKDLGFNVSTLHSKLSNDEIKIRLKEFQEISSKPKILISVLMLTTGFDMPEVDCAVLARPTKSQNLYKQMIGRILRLHDNKKRAILLDCGNVIENLGMPLEPIKYKKVQEWNQIQICKECGSSHFKLIKEKGVLTWKCIDCGFTLENNIKNGFACKSCNEVHSDDSLFSMENERLVLNCPCGEETIISITKGKEKILLVFEDERYLPFEEAREYVRNQNLAWHIYKKLKPKYIPNNPDIVYKDFGWINWSDWIGKNIQYDKKYLNYKEAKQYLQKFKINSKEKWANFLKSDFTEQIPQFPDQYYRKVGWVNWDDWFEINPKKEISNRFNNISYEEAKNYVKKLHIHSEIQWKDFYNKCYPYYDYPLQPKDIFSKEWESWKDWLDIK